MSSSGCVEASLVQPVDEVLGNDQMLLKKLHPLVPVEPVVEESVLAFPVPVLRRACISEKDAVLPLLPGRDSL